MYLHGIKQHVHELTIRVYNIVKDLFYHDPELKVTVFVMSRMY